MYIDVVPASPNIAQDLELKKGNWKNRVQRIQLADGHPTAIMKNYIPAGHTVPGIGRTIDKVTVHKSIWRTGNISIETAHDRISARNADFSEFRYWMCRWAPFCV